MTRTILVTGARGFIGSNLVLQLKALPDVKVVAVAEASELAGAVACLGSDDLIFHLAGVNRPPTPDAFEAGNVELTRTLCNLLIARGIAPMLVLSSSTQAALDNPYGSSKRQAEELVRGYAQQASAQAIIYRLPNVFGKWARPNYNSVVATFCYNIANDLPIQINDPAAALSLLYIDDLMDAWLELAKGETPRTDSQSHGELPRIYNATVGELAEMISAFKASRSSLVTEPVGAGLPRALHATYLSYLRPEQFSYSLKTHADPRGQFVEMVKTRDSGQVSFFTCRPGITRGGHYHHSKTEKFLVVRGQALFRFRHMATGEAAQLETTDAHFEIVETVPGWTHDITNIGDEDMIVMLWANEIFDPNKPDTFQEPLLHGHP